MKFIKETIHNESLLSDINKYLPIAHQYLFLDIETTGLSHQNKIMLIGLVYLDELHNITLMQLFDENGHSEFQILEKLIDIIDDFNIDYFISFNGNAFDFPFINARLKYHKFSRTLNKNMNIDLLKIARIHKNMFNVTPLNLKNIEKYLGIKRIDTISGKESITQYFNYLKTKSPQMETSILRHNYDDILNMLPLVQLLNYENNMDLIFPLKLYSFNLQTWYLTDLNIVNDKLTIMLNAHRPYTDQSLHIADMYFTIEKKEQSIKVQLEIHQLNSLNQTVVLVNPNIIYQNSFDQLTHDEQQSLIIKINETWQYEEIQQILQFLFNKHIFKN